MTCSFLPGYRPGSGLSSTVEWQAPLGVRRETQAPCCVLLGQSGVQRPERGRCISFEISGDHMVAFEPPFSGSI